MQEAIIRRGWACALMARRRPDGHWGSSVYNPKWTCTHYVLYELVQLGVSDTLKALKQSALLLLDNPRGADGGINYARTIEHSDVCINGMILTMTAYFGVAGPGTRHIVDYLLKVQMRDGGWNCEYHHGATHSSLHTTIAVIEGFWTLRSRGGLHRVKAIDEAVRRGVEFILRHELFRSDTTGEVIRDEFFRFAFPVRWKYDILRCIDLFRKYDVPYDRRMDAALDIIEKARTKSGAWKAASQAGKTYFMMEKNGSESKWNTLRALRVLVKYGRISPAF